MKERKKKTKEKEMKERKKKKKETKKWRTKKKNKEIGKNIQFDSSTLNF